MYLTLRAIEDKETIEKRMLIIQKTVSKIKEETKVMVDLAARASNAFFENAREEARIEKCYGLLSELSQYQIRVNQALNDLAELKKVSKMTREENIWFRKQLFEIQQDYTFVSQTCECLAKAYNN